ncbi:MAG: helix-turn-helix domain-containing protein, partial [Actinomycetota bacterium]
MVERREQRRQLVHDEVRAAAIAHMSLRGFDGVTVEEIAATTSVSASTIYRHFGTKEALVLTPGRPSAVVGRFADDTKRDTPDAMRRAVNKVYGKDDDVPAELRLVVGNAGLLDQFHREWRAADAGLAEALAA